MKSYKSILVLLIACAITCLNANAQNTEEKIEKRAKMLHETFTKSDKNLHKKFIEENFSSKLLEKYEISRHTNMLKKLNRDFGNSNIISIVTSNKSAKMVIERISDKHKVTFDISFDPNEEYKINGFNIEAGEL